MDMIKKLAPLFTAGIFLISFLALLLTGFGYMLGPIKKDISRLESGQVKLEDGQVKLEDGQVKLEKRMDRIENKLDDLIAVLRDKKTISLNNQTK